MNKSAYFSSLASEWETRHTGLDERRGLKRLTSAFRLEPGDRILDAGCGTGRLYPFLRTAVGPEGWIIELDFAPDMLRIARNKFGRDRVGFLQANSERLPFLDCVFDAVICFSLFPHLDHHDLAAAEYFRVLVPGGTLFIAHLMGREELNRMHRRTSGPVKHDQLPDSATMTEILKSAGFSPVRITDRPGFYLAEAEKPGS